MNHFPKSFVWGTATSSYQVEGAAEMDGRGPSIWDAFCKTPGKIAGGEHGDVACDHYHRFEEDVALMKSLNMKAYRFSISWSRLLPEGKGQLNPEGVAFYNRLIDTLIYADITPWVTLYHWDLPLKLEEEEGGWLKADIVTSFTEYADHCFREFGDRVKHWITLNEPWCSSVLGYGLGEHAPGLSDPDAPYLAAHHMILAHAHVVELYRKQYAHQSGQIGITNNCDFRYPLTERQEDVEAAERSLQFFLGWFADPIWLGDYPEVMRERLGERLPTFSEQEKALIHGSSDFFGLNHYSTMMAADNSEGKLEQSSTLAGNGGMIDDQGVLLSVDPKWKQTHMGWNVVPEGCKDLLLWIHRRYGQPSIYITENGCAVEENDRDQAIHDEFRRSFFESYLGACSEALESGVNLKGYFAWSFMDNFEWSHGYSKKFGICHVDSDTLERTPKASALWLRDFIGDQQK